MIAFSLLRPTLQTHVEGAPVNLDSSGVSMVFSFLFDCGLLSGFTTAVSDQFKCLTFPIPSQQYLALPCFLVPLLAPLQEESSQTPHPSVWGATALGYLVLGAGFVGWILSARSTSSVDGCAVQTVSRTRDSKFVFSSRQQIGSFVFSIESDPSRVVKVSLSHFKSDEFHHSNNRHFLNIKIKME